MINLKLLLDQIARELNIDRDKLDQYSASDSFQEWDSFSVIKLALMLEREYGVSPSEENLNMYKSVNGILLLLE